MSYTIQTIEFHKEALAFAKECAAKRTEDVGLSVWADNAIIGFHEFAIDALELGAEHGMNGPAMMATRLMKGDRVVAAEIVQSEFGPVWKLSADEAAKFGRKFVPTGSKSRIQKQLGLAETKMAWPAQRQVLNNANYAGVTYILQEAPKAV
jgi:hypothetical protein